MMGRNKPFGSLAQYDSCAYGAKQTSHPLDQILANAENEIMEWSTNDEVVRHWFETIRETLRIERLVQDDFREHMRAEVREMRKEAGYDYV